MLTDRGRWILALGGGIYLAAWAFGSKMLYPVAIGLVLAVIAAALWVRFLNRPMNLRRNLGRGERLAGDDIPVQLELDVDGLAPSGTLVLREKIARLGERETLLVRRNGRLKVSRPARCGLRSPTPPTTPRSSACSTPTTWCIPTG